MTILRHVDWFFIWLLGWFIFTTLHTCAIRDNRIITTARMRNHLDYATTTTTIQKTPLPLINATQVEMMSLTMSIIIHTILMLGATFITQNVILKEGMTITTSTVKRERTREKGNSYQE